MGDEMKNRIIDIKGFEPNADETKALQLKLAQVQDEAPSGSFISVKLEKIEDTFQGIANIFFGPGEPLNASAEAKNLMDMAQDLSKKIRAEIKTWRSSRFAEEELA
jgi:hypothetical protein